MSINKFSLSDIRWRVEGPFDSTYSLAILNRELSRALVSLGIDVALHSTEGPGDFDPSPEFLAFNSDIQSINNRAKSMSQDVANVTSRNLYPPRVSDMTCSTRLLHSYAWEETSLPTAWIRDFNTYLSGMTCLSKHVMKIMQDNGVSLPMSVSGCGVDHWERINANPSYNLNNRKLRTFRFLHVSSFFPRKGPAALLESYGKAFSNNDDITLVIKTFPNPHNRIHDLLLEHRNAKADYPDVVVIEDDLLDPDLKALYEQCHVLVAPSCAEGFGLPLAEAMLSGIPVITTGWSGQLDFCNSENSWLVDYSFQQTDTHFKLVPSAWAAIDHDALACAMKTAANTPADKRKNMAQLGRNLLLKDFTWKSVAQRLINFYQFICERKPLEQPRIGWISTWNVKCGIATYSEHLLKHFPLEVHMLAAKNLNTITTDGKNCTRCWEVCDDDDLSGLTAEIDKIDLDTIIIQFNFGFFQHESLLNFIEYHKSVGRTILVDIHATIDPPQAPHKRMEYFAPAFAMCDRLLVHTVADMNQMKFYNLTEKLVLFPHGILEVPEQEKILTKIPTIATYGFCLPHKGLIEVVQAVGLLRDAGHTVNLKMINSEYPVPFSKDLVNEINNQITKLALEKQVYFESQFLEDSETIQQLKDSNLIVFAYHPTSESASGAVRYGLASGRPTLVTNLPIFDEFGEAVWRVENHTPEALSSKIWHVLEEIRLNSVQNQERILLSQKFCEQHNYSWLSERLMGLIKSLKHTLAFDAYNMK